MNKIMYVILAAAITLSAQGYYPDSDPYNPNSGRSGWGIKGGMNIAKFDGDDADGFDSKKGLVFGIFKNTPVSGTTSIQWELLYTMKGAHFEYDYEYYYKQVYEIDIDFNFNYLELPVLYKFNLSANSSVLPNLYIGGAAAYNIEAELEASMDGETETEDYDYASEFEFGFIVGGGVEIPLRKGSFILDARYNHGLTSVIDEEDIEVYNRVWSFTAGYGF
mgnify:CR=1 FL=1|jgi:opacity protein-like surface antigen